MASHDLNGKEPIPRWGSASSPPATGTQGMWWCRDGAQEPRSDAASDQDCIITPLEL